MKHIIALFSVLFLISFVSTDPITERERKFASDFLQNTQQTLIESVKGLSKEQLTFKAGADRWSIEDCVKHIAFSEQGLKYMTDSVINSAPNPEKRNEIKVTDQQIIDMISDRSAKFKAPEQIQPQNSPYKSLEEALRSFSKTRGDLIQYVNTTDKPLRDHVVAFPVGHFDSYQMMLFIGAHSRRHTLQIEEVKADPAFPKK